MGGGKYISLIISISGLLEKQVTFWLFDTGGAVESWQKKIHAVR